MTGDAAVFAQLYPGGIDPPADLHGLRAARMEMAARGRRQGGGDLAFEFRHHHLRLGVGHRRGVAQHARIGMQRIVEDRGHRAFLDDPAQIHDGDAAAEMTDHAQVVGDEDEAQLAPLLQPAQQHQDLRLDRDVERRNRLVRDDQLRLQHERAGDADALALAAAELVRIFVGGIAGHADLSKHGAHGRRDLAPGATAMHGHRLRQGLADRAARVEGGIGILEHDLHLAAQAPEQRGARRQHILAPEAHAAGIGLG